MKGGDHAASLEEPGLTKLIRDIRVIESALGTGDKEGYLLNRSLFYKISEIYCFHKENSEGYNTSKRYVNN